MNYDEAKRQFKHALDNQQTISISKLKNIMMALNITLEPSRDKEIEYLKGEIERLAKKCKNFKKRLKNQENRKKLCVDCGKEERNPGLEVCGPCYHKRIWGDH